MRLKILLASIPSSVVLLLLGTTPARCSADFDFSAYPESTRTCLEDAADDSTCTDASTTEANTCLCGNTDNFVLNSAACIGDQGADVLSEVYELMQESCSDTRTPLAVSEAEWFRAGNGTTVTVTSTVTTTSAGVLTTFTTTSTGSHIGSTATPTVSSASSTSSPGPGQGITASTKIVAITSSVAGALAIASVVCMFLMLKKRRMDQKEIRAAREAGHGGGLNESNGKSLLNPGQMTTPGSRSPLKSSVTPPPPSEPGASRSSQVWRSSLPQPSRLSTPASPTELPSHQPPCELPDNGVGGGHGTQCPSPVSQGVGTMGSWCPSPLSHSNTMATYDSTTSTAGPISALSPTLSRQITRSWTVRSSWAHERPALEGPYELAGNEIEHGGRADSMVLGRISERQSTSTIRQAPPEYSSEGWVDPNGDKMWI